MERFFLVPTSAPAVVAGLAIGALPFDTDWFVLQTTLVLEGNSTGGFGDTETARLRSLREWSENRLDELAVGLLACFLGGVSLPMGTRSNATFPGQNLATFSPFVLAAIAGMLALMTKRVRAKIIFPRTGYVVFRLLYDGRSRRRDVGGGGRRRGDGFVGHAALA
jgi:hypothetical protein